MRRTKSIIAASVGVLLFSVVATHHFSHSDQPPPVRIAAAARKADPEPRAISIADVEAKMARKQPLSSAEASALAVHRYHNVFAARVSDRNPLLHNKPRAEVNMCSDARLHLGDAPVRHQLAVNSYAGNAHRNRVDISNTIVFVGHGGFVGCGAVHAAHEAKEHQHPSDDPDIRAITTDAVSPRALSAMEPSRQNVISECRRAERGGENTAYGIYVDLKRQSVEQVYGHSSPLVRELMQSIEAQLQGARGLDTQYAAFVTIARADRRLPAKTVLGLGLNEAFSSGCIVKPDGSVVFNHAQIGSVEYAVSNVGGVKQSKLLVVLRKMALATQQQFPDAQVLAFHEQPLAGVLKPVAF